MKTQILRISTLVTLLFLLQITSFASKRIDGNGKITTQQKAVKQFYKVNVGTFCNVKVISGSMPMYSLKVDENLQEYYTIELKDGVLHITAEEWPEPTSILLTIQAPFINEFSNSGWGTIQINDLNTENFTLNANTGNVTLSGEVQQLTINAGTGTINAGKMTAKKINLHQNSHGKSVLGTSQSINISGELGKVSYYGNPIVNKEAASQSLSIKSIENYNIILPKKVDLKYVTVTIKNNSFGWSGFVIRGPKMHDFSYGFSILPYNSKRERIPVGTKFYKKTLGGTEKELISISANDDCKTINLFQ